VKKTTRKLAVGFIVGALTLGVAAPAFAGGGKGAKCNSGRGNGSEVAGDDCDPGNSVGHNNGGDF